jgi:hypothetical protein
MAIVATADKEVAQVQSELRNTTNALYRSMACTKAILRNLDEVAGIKQALKYDDESTASELWDEIDMKDQEDLMLAPTKGGTFTTKERAIITSFWRVSVAEMEASRNI